MSPFRLVLSLVESLSLVELDLVEFCVVEVRLSDAAASAAKAEHKYGP